MIPGVKEKVLARNIPNNPADASNRRKLFAKNIIPAHDTPHRARATA